MCKLSNSLTFYCFLFIVGFCTHVFAQPKTDLTAPFAFENGDRVLFVGNSLIENDVQFGYLELALTTRWPNRNLTFRNIGWSGDNVFGDARSYVTTPPTPYELLMQQITEAKPTVVFVAYGGIEAQEGEEGLPRFKQGLNQLIDKIDQLGAKTILVSPIPLLVSPSESVSQKNSALETYGSVIEQIAKARNKRFINVFRPILEAGKQSVITENGVHLNATGYYHLATFLEKGLGWTARNEGITLDV
ncbi:MAG TPA: GDSL family lipase, partial [Runella sp.]|nr:GDSL family lipase [Runella sp.]